MSSPRKSHLKVVLNAIKHLKKDLGRGLFFPSRNMKLEGYCDLDWASCPETRRFVTRFLVKLGKTIISWESKKQTTISRSFAKAERSVVSEIILFTGLFTNLLVYDLAPMYIDFDSKVAIQIVSNSVYHQRTKHIMIDCRCVHEKLQSGLINLKHVVSGE